MHSTEPEWEVISVKGQKNFQGIDVPLVLAPKQNSKQVSLVDWLKKVKESKSWLEEKASHHGGILFRGFPVHSPHDFNSFVESLGYTPLPYLGGAAPRTNIVGGVFTTNESPSHLTIVFHHELAQTPKYPQKLFFFCETPPTSGGETPIVLSNVVYERMKEKFPEFVEAVEKHGVRYTRILPHLDDHSSTSGRGWQSTWQTKDKQEAELRAKDFGSTVEWLPNGAMKLTSCVLPAVKEDKRINKKVWFNQVGSVHPEYGWKDSLNDPAKSCTIGNGDPIPTDIIVEMVKIEFENAVEVGWEKGDVVMLDNLVVLHGRRSFTGPRSILAYLAQ